MFLKRPVLYTTYRLRVAALVHRFMFHPLCSFVSTRLRSKLPLNLPHSHQSDPYPNRDIHNLQLYYTSNHDCFKYQLLNIDRSPGLKDCLHCFTSLRRSKVYFYLKIYHFYVAIQIGQQYLDFKNIGCDHPRAVLYTGLKKGLFISIILSFLLFQIVYLLVEK